MTDPTPAEATDGFDRGAAVTRSMLGWGVVAGPFYLVFALILALTRDGFDLTRDALSMLLIGDLGWLQWLNFALAGVMTVVAAVGLRRTPDWSPVPALLVGLYGVSLVLAAVFPPDASEDFPPGAGGGEFTTTGLLHFAAGTVGFISIGIAAILATAWLRNRGAARAPWSRVAGVVTIVAFVAGAVLGGSPAGVGFLWIAVLTTWAWLAGVSVAAYRAVPHPVLARRVPAGGVR